MDFRRILAYFPLLAAFAFLISCDLGIEFPDYFIEVRTKDLKLAYNDGTNIEVEYKFVAENNQHRCKYILTNGSAVEIESELTEFVSAGQWHLLPPIDVSSNEGKYSVKVIVQSATTDDQPVDMNFLNKSVVFYFDDTPPNNSDIGIDPMPLLTSNPINVVLTHPDQLDPNASPVTLYYTVDGDGPIEYCNPFSIDVPGPDQSNPIELRVYAEDCVNTTTSPEKIFFYNFLNIIKVTNPGETTEDTVVDSTLVVVNKDLHGIGFSSIDSVEVYDHDGTSVITSYIFVPDSLIGVTIRPGDIKSDPNGTEFESGVGTIEIADNDTGVTDIYAIQIQ